MIFGHSITQTFPTEQDHLPVDRSLTEKIPVPQTSPNLPPDLFFLESSKIHAPQTFPKVPVDRLRGVPGSHSVSVDSVQTKEKIDQTEQTFRLIEHPFIVWWMFFALARFCWVIGHWWGRRRVRGAFNRGTSEVGRGAREALLGG